MISPISTRNRARSLERALARQLMSERAMTAPRQFLPETTYLVTRRTERRHHLFRPDAVMSQSFLYCLAYAANRSGVVIHCACLLSNHYHVVLHDVRGRAPRFTEILNGLLTKCTQAHRGWNGRVLDGQGPSYVELLTDDAIVDKIGYTLVNATAAGLVRFAVTDQRSRDAHARRPC